MIASQRKIIRAALPLFVALSAATALGDVEICENRALPGVHVVVAGYTSGRLIAPELMARGVAKNQIIHVHPAPSIPPIYQASFNATHYGTLLTRTRDSSSLNQEVLRQVRLAAGDRPILSVVAGSEPGVELADFLAFQLGPRGQNRYFLSHTRRDKADMQQRLANAGLAYIRGIRSSNWEEISRWVGTSRRRTPWPLVIKPLDSAGTQGVSIVANEAELRDAFLGLVGTENLFGQPIREILVQEYIEGEEIVINTMSLNGEHRIVESWLYHKSIITTAYGTRVPMYVHDDLLSLNSPRVQAVAGYAFDVLNALGFENGAGHLEIMLTSTGPVLVEAGARLGGGYPLASRLASGRAPIDHFIDTIVAPNRFREFVRAPIAIHANSVRILQVLSYGSGRVLGYRGIERLRALPSYREHHLEPVGGTIEPTTNLANSTGTILLAHPDPAQIAADTAVIRNELERALFITQ